MPNGLPQRPTSTFFPQQPAVQQPSGRIPPELQNFQQMVGNQVSEFSSRVSLMEQKAENLRRHIELLDSSLIEKHKSVVTEIRDVQDGMRGLRADIEYVKDLSERLAKRMEALASKDEVKVLQRYTEYWNPLQFVTKSEVKSMVENILKEHKIK